MMKPYNFSEYNLLLDKRDDNFMYKIVVSLFIIGIIFLIFKFKLYIYEKNILFKVDNYYGIVVNINQINELFTTSKIIINKQEYTYKVMKIDDEFSNINGTIYQTLYLDIDYPNVSKVLECRFLKKKSTILGILIEFIKGG